MDPKEYVKNVLVTENRDMAPLQERFSQIRTIRLLHGAIGLASELAELRQMANEDEIDAVNLKEEIGDVYWYMGIMIDELKADPDRIFSIHSSLGDPNDDDEQKSESLGWAIGAMTIHIGEAIDLLKKSLIYGKPLDEEKLKNKLSSLDFAAAHALGLYGIVPAESRARNIEKLKARYGDKFSEAAALERNLAAEREILEKKN